MYKKNTLLDNERVRSRSLILYITFLTTLIVILSVVAAIFQKKMYNAFGMRLVFFRQELTNLLFDIYVSCFYLYTLFFTDLIKKRFAFRKVLLLALLDGGADFLRSIGGVNSPGTFQVLSQNTIIFFTMIFAFVLVRARYTPLQMLGAFLVIGGAAAGALAHFEAKSHRTANAPSDGAVLFAVLLYTSSFIPNALSNVLKQRYIQDEGIHIFQLATFVSWLQLPLSWIYVPILSLRSFGGVALSQIPAVLSDGARCFFADKSIAIHNAAGHVIGHCSIDVPIVTLLFSTSGFAAGILSLFLVKKASATVMVVAQACALPLANLLFSVHFIMRSQTEPFSYVDIIGLLLVILGFLLFSIQNEKRKATTKSIKSNSEAKNEATEKDFLINHE